jgi:hypothetical protein
VDELPQASVARHVLQWVTDPFGLLVIASLVIIVTVGMLHPSVVAGAVNITVAPQAMVASRAQVIVGDVISTV